MHSGTWLKLGLLAGALGVIGAFATASYSNAQQRELVNDSSEKCAENAARLLAMSIPSPIVDAIVAERGLTTEQNDRLLKFLDAAIDTANSDHSLVAGAFVVRSKGPNASALVMSQFKPLPDVTPTGSPDLEPFAGFALNPSATASSTIVEGRGEEFGDRMFILSPIMDSANRAVAWAGLEIDESRLGYVVADLKSRILWFALIAGTVIAGVALVGAWFLTARLRRLSDSMLRMVAGDESVHIEDDSHDECGVLARGINHAALAAKRHDELRRSMKLGEVIQRALLPATTPRIPGVQIAHFCVYCDQVGGDYIDYVPMGGGDLVPEAWAILVGDGTGHGVPAALLMATARSVLRSQTLKQDSLAQCFEQINRRLCQQIPEGRFLTLFALVVGAQGRGVRWLSAGHDEAIVFDPATMQFSELKGSDIPLGVDAQWSFSDYAAAGPLPRGAVIVVGTDGIWEMRNAAGAMFGKDQLRRVIRRSFNEPPHVIGEAIIAALDQHRGAVPPQDDVTFVVMRVGE